MLFICLFVTCYMFFSIKSKKSSTLFIIYIRYICMQKLEKMSRHGFFVGGFFLND